jgi:hypothetical protein
VGAAECTGNWTADEVPFIDAPTSFLSDVAAISPSDVWAVGGSGSFTSAGQITNSRLVLIHWDGGTWKTVEADLIENARLVAVSGTGPNDVWAVGTGGPLLNQLIMHWDGSEWKQIPTPDVANSRLSAVVAISANDAWVAGDFIDKTSGVHKLLLEHWDGSTWSQIPPIDFGIRNIDIPALVATASNDVWAGGVLFDPQEGNTPVRHRTYLHWDGTAWTQTAAPDVGAAGFSLRGMAAVSASDVWAVGDPLTDDGGPLIEHWDGSAWTTSAGPTAHQSLSGIDMVSAGEGWAVGGDTSPSALIAKWDGASWTTVENSLADNGLLVAMASLSSGESWAVGYEDTGHAASNIAVQHICFPGRTLNPSEAVVPTPVPEDDSGGLSSAAIGIIAAAVVAGVVIVGGGAYLMLRRRG